MKKLIKYIKISIALFAVLFITGCNTAVIKENKEIRTDTEIKSDSYNKEKPKSIVIDSEKQKEYVFYYTEDDAVDIAKVLFKECGGVQSTTEQACVAWCILNRVDMSNDSIYNIIRAPNQFAFDECTEIREDLYLLSGDVLKRWNDEKNGIKNTGRVLPKEYIYFHGDGVHNYFRDAFNGNYNIWDYSMPSPYID